MLLLLISRDFSSLRNACLNTIAPLWGSAQDYVRSSFGDERNNANALSVSSSEKKKSIPGLSSQNLARGGTNNSLFPVSVGVLCAPRKCALAPIILAWPLQHSEGTIYVKPPKMSIAPEYLNEHASILWNQIKISRRQRLSLIVGHKCPPPTPSHGGLSNNTGILSFQIWCQGSFNVTREGRLER